MAEKANKETTTENGSSFSFTGNSTNATSGGGGDGSSSGRNSTATGRRGLPVIQTQRKPMDSETAEVCHDDSTPPVRAQTIHELHSLQKKKSAPTTPIRTTQGPFANISEEERQRHQLQSIRYTHN